jgi:hypothetical protein
MSIYRDLYCYLQYLNYPKPQKVLFDHLPKCGGITVNHYLISQYRKKRIYQIDSRNAHSSLMAFKSLPEATRYTYDVTLGHFADELFDFVHPDTISMTIFREPVDRIISHFYYVKENSDHYLHEIVTNNNMRLEEYVTSGISIELRNWYVQHFLGVSIAEAENHPDQSVAEAYRFVKDRYHIIGFLDDLDTAMDNLREKAGYRKRFKNSYLNRTANRPRKNEIDASVLNTIEQVNFLDVELYGKLKNNVN